jgi:hypothetical protein
MATATLILLLAATGPVGSDFEVRTPEGEPAVGAVQSLAADGTLVVGHRTFAAGDWYAVRRVSAVLPAWPRARHVELNTGDRVVGTVAGADGDAVRMRLTIPGTKDQSIRFPLSAVRAVWLTTRPANEPSPDWLTAPRKRDLFLARNGDSAAGALTSIDPATNSVAFQADGRDHRLEFSKLAAIAFNTDLARIRRPKGPFYRLTLVDGTRLNVQTATFDGSMWTATTLFKDTVQFAADQLVSVDIEQGKVTYLSDLKPVKYLYRTFDGEQYAWMADRSVAGRPMTLRGTSGESTFDRGLGLHAECAVTYSLGGKYRRFEALAGLDARSGARGNATLIVRMDGKEQELSSGGRLTDAGGPVTVGIDVTGAKELTIEVRRGAGGHVQDHVNLAEARLIP